MSKKVYISGAITFDTDYEARFEEAERLIRKQGWDPINPAKINKSIQSLPYEDIMRVCMNLVDIADAVYMLPTWENSKGANREYGYALGTGKEIIFYDEDMLDRYRRCKE